MTWNIPHFVISSHRCDTRVCRSHKRAEHGYCDERMFRFLRGAQHCLLSTTKNSDKKDLRQERSVFAEKEARQTASTTKRCSLPDTFDDVLPYTLSPPVFVFYHGCVQRGHRAHTDSHMHRCALSSSSYPRHTLDT